MPRPPAPPPEIIEDIVTCTCGKKMMVYNARPRVIGGYRVFCRRKKCVGCGIRISTVEMPADIANDVLRDD